MFVQFPHFCKTKYMYYLHIKYMSFVAWITTHLFICFKKSNLKWFWKLVSTFTTHSHKLDIPLAQFLCFFFKLYPNSKISLLRFWSGTSRIHTCVCLFLLLRNQGQTESTNNSKIFQAEAIWTACCLLLSGFYRSPKEWVWQDSDNELSLLLLCST